jgi:hypothetical protein
MQGASRDMDHWVPVARSGFEQDHSCPVLAQSCGDDAPRRARANDNIVGMQFAHFDRLSPLRPIWGTHSLKPSAVH